MKHEITNYFLNVVVVLAILSLGSFLLDKMSHYYYKNSNLENFFERGEMLALDVCEGDINQSILSTRIVKGTEIGYKIEVVRELIKIGSGKVWEEKISAFSEVSSNGNAQRVQRLPDWLEEGEYKWILYIELKIRNDVYRELIPPLESNVFKIKSKESCYESTILTT